MATVPDWLTKRDGGLRPGFRKHMRFVMIGGKPLYQLEVRPAVGKFECVVQQSNNGHRLDSPANIYPTEDAALAGGLDQLRTALGW